MMDHPDNVDLLPNVEQDLKDKSLMAYAPDIVKEWHPTKNLPLSPSIVTYGSHRRVWWVCENGHEWETAIFRRTIRKTSCPDCKRDNRSLMDYAPELVKEWHPTKNLPLTPTTVTYGSRKKVWWVCENSHEWEDAVFRRTAGKATCPECKQKKKKLLIDANPRIAAEWHPVKNIGMNMKKVYERASIRAWWLCGKGHEWQERVDYRTRNNTFCKKCAVGRSRSKSILLSAYPEIASEWHTRRNDELEAVEINAGSNKKVWWRCRDGHEWEDIVRVRTKNNQQCPVCTNLLKNKRPDLFALLHPTMNIRSLEHIPYNSKELFWWKCEKGHEFEETITRMKRRDPGSCLGHEKQRETLSTYPDLQNEWHPHLNENLLPKDVSIGTIKKVWWVCGKCYSEYEKRVSDRVRGEGCPYCAGKKVNETNSLAERYPEIAKEWNTEKNNGLSPTQVSYGSNKLVWWICERGHEWQAEVWYRIHRKQKCRDCKKSRFQ